MVDTSFAAHKGRLLCCWEGLTFRKQGWLPVQPKELVFRQTGRISLRARKSEALLIDVDNESFHGLIKEPLKVMFSR